MQQEAAVAGFVLARLPRDFAPAVFHDEVILRIALPGDEAAEAVAGDAENAVGLDGEDAAGIFVAADGEPVVPAGEVFAVPELDRLGGNDRAFKRADFLGLSEGGADGQDDKQQASRASVQTFSGVEREA